MDPILNRLEKRRRLNPAQPGRMRVAWAMAALLLLGPWPLLAFRQVSGPPPYTATGPSRDSSPAARLRIEVRGQAPEAASTALRDVSRAPLQAEIVDPCLGTRWRLVPDTQHPERPGRLVLSESGLASPSKPSSEAAPATSPIIRAGERVAVFQTTPMLRARFEAVALESAAAGKPMRVRLLPAGDARSGNQGTVVDVRAIAAGEAIWLGVHPSPH